MSGPKISIITVVKNDASGLEKTILSACGQQETTPELIVVDGGSTDGTMAVIRSYQDKITFWSSAPDHGIFDAMNKGLAMATGDWVLFLNSGDVLSGPRVLAMLAEKDGVASPATGVSNGDGHAGVVYGDSIADYGPFRVYRAAGRPGELWKGMFCNHQSMLFRREILLSLPAGPDRSGQAACFDAGLRISADHDLICRLYSAGVNFVHVPVPIAVWETQGISNRLQVRSVAERYRMTRLYFNTGITVKVYYLWLLILAILVQGMYRLIPASLMMRFIRFANRKSLLKQSTRSHP